MTSKKTKKMRNFTRTEYMIMGALGGFIASEMDIAFKTLGYKFPIGSFLFVIVVLSVFIYDWKIRE